MYMMHSCFIIPSKWVHGTNKLVYIQVLLCIQVSGSMQVTRKDVLVQLDKTKKARSKAKRSKKEKEKNAKETPHRPKRLDGPKERDQSVTIDQKSKQTKRFV